MLMSVPAARLGGMLQAVKGALRAGVDPTGVLSLVAEGQFSTKNSIQVTVR